MKISVKSILSLCLIVLLFMFVFNLVTYEDGLCYAEDINYISTREDFLLNIQKGTKKIYVDDITFNDNQVIGINYSVEIIGKDQKSTLKNAHFKTEGHNVAGSRITISFKNLIMDGMVDKGDYDFETDNQMFEDIFEDKREKFLCIDATYGFYTLTLDNCEIKRYCSYEAPAIKTANDAAFDADNQIVEIKNCNFNDNISYNATVKLAHQQGIYAVNNCNFTKNLAKEASGIAITNGKATVNNCNIYDNEYYRFKFSDALIQDKLTVSEKQYNYVSMIGALYVGAVDITVKGCKITGNECLYGGGVGFASPSNVGDNEKIEFLDCIIANNKAECGGGIYGQSKSGHYAKFINCMIYGNSAKKGGALYVTNLAPWMSSWLGGNVEFIFCTIVGNKSDDKTNFEFHDYVVAENVGFIKLYGCFVVDESPYSANGMEYNYVATKTQALNDNVVTVENLNNLDDSIKPIKGSLADITISPDIYGAWIGGDSSALSERKAGALIIEENVKKEKFPYWVIVFPIAGIIGIVTIIIIFKKKQKGIKDSIKLELENSNKEKKLIDYTSLSEEELTKKLKEIYLPYKLTNKEFEIAELLLTDIKRKEIAEKMFLSEDTIKTHIAHIYKKLNISSREELRILTNEIMNKNENPV